MAEVSARELLQQELNDLIAQFEVLKRNIDAKRRALSALDEIENSSGGGDNGPSSAIYIRPNEFANMEIAQGVEKYLGMVAERYPTTREIPPQHLYRDIMPALVKGGCRLSKKGDSKRHDRNLKIAVRMNSKSRNSLYYDDKTETVALRSWHKEKAARTA